MKRNKTMEEARQLITPEIKVHVITWDEEEYDRISTQEEIDLYRKQGFVVEDGYSCVIFDFRHHGVKNYKQ